MARATGSDAAVRLKLRSSDVWRWLKQRRSSGALHAGVVLYLGLKPEAIDLRSSAANRNQDIVGRSAFYPLSVSVEPNFDI